MTVLSATRSRVIVRIRNRGMFASGSATLEPRFAPLLRRIGEALREEPGAVQVLGHTDNQPIRTVRFPSNFHLSAARAEAAHGRDRRGRPAIPARFTAEGRGGCRAASPDNATAGGARGEPPHRSRVCTGVELMMQPLFASSHRAARSPAWSASLLLGGVIWLFGPLLGGEGFRPLRGADPRLGLAAVPVLVWLLVVTCWSDRRRREARRGAGGEAPRADEPGAEAAPPRRRRSCARSWPRALARSKHATGGKGGYLYELPWYVIIGPPGSGKTTALAQFRPRIPAGRWRQASPASAARATATGGSPTTRC